MERQECTTHCPYCGEQLSLLLDPMEAGSDYIEDCQVCCRPIEFSVYEGGGGELVAEVRSDVE